MYGQVMKMLDGDIIEPLISRYNSVVMIKKKMENTDFVFTLEKSMQHLN